MNAVHTAHAQRQWCDLDAYFTHAQPSGSPQSAILFRHKLTLLIINRFYGTEIALL